MSKKIVLNKGINTVSELTSNNNINNYYGINNTGLYAINYATNAPYPYGMLFVMASDSGTCFQLFFSTNGLDVFVRSRTGSSWSSWKNIVDGTWH